MAADDPAAAKPVPSRGHRTRHVRKLVVPLVLAVGMVAAASALVTTGVGCGDDDGPRPDGHPGDGDVDTPII